MSLVIIRIIHRLIKQRRFASLTWKSIRRGGVGSATFRSNFGEAFDHVRYFWDHLTNLARLNILKGLLHLLHVKLELLLIHPEVLLLIAYAILELLGRVLINSGCAMQAAVRPHSPVTPSRSKLLALLVLLQQVDLRSRSA